MKNKVGIIVFHIGAFGGASKRYSNLFHYLSQKHSDNFYFIVNQELYDHLKNILPHIVSDKIIVVGDKTSAAVKTPISSVIPGVETVKDFVGDQLSHEARYSFLRKVWLYIKHYRLQRKLYTEIRQVVKEYKLNVLMAVFGGAFPLYFYIGKRQRPSLIFSNMDSWFFELHPQNIRYWYRKYFSFNTAHTDFDRIDFLSPFIYEGVKKAGIHPDPGKVSITPCSFIDYSKCEVGRKEKFAIAFAGRLEENKNPLLYLEAAKQILKKYPEVKFYLLGDGILREKLERYIYENRLSESIIFKFHKNPPEIFSDTTVFVSLQSTNNYPSQSVLEAMACGNVIVATDVGDTRMFINQENGILIKPGLDHLCDALHELISNPAKAKSMGEQARRYAMENHTIDRHAQYYINLFESNSEQSK